MRTTKPAPFAREAIDLSHHGKTWQTIQATQLREGDIVAGGQICGGLVGRQALTTPPGESSVGWWINSTLVWLDPEDELFIFGPAR